MYKNFEKLLKKNNETAYQVAKATGIAPSVLSDWKRNISVPKADKLLAIAKHFGVSIEELLKE